MVAVAVVLGYCGIAMALLVIGGLRGNWLMAGIGIAMYTAVPVAAGLIETGPGRRWRERRLRPEAEALGLDVSAEDRFGLTELPLAVSTGLVEVFNVFWGEREGVDVRCFQYWVTEVQPGERVRGVALAMADAPNPDPRKDYYRCAVAALERPAPRLVLARQKRVRKLAGRAERPRVTVSERRFDSTFEAYADDPALAARLLDDGLRAWLLAGDEDWNFELVEGWAACYLEPVAETVPLLDAVEGFRREALAALDRSAA